MKDEDILDFLNKSLNNMFDILNNKTFKCSVLLLKYIYDDDLDAFLEYEKLYQSLNLEEQKQVCINVAGNIIEHYKNDVKEKKI